MSRKWLANPLEPLTGRPDRVLDRREFLQWQLGSAAFMTLGAASLSLPRAVRADVVPALGLAKGEPGPATRAAVGLLGGMQSVVKPGNKVVIKPNMSFEGGPEAATTTNPEVVRELVAMCREAGAGRIRILDHPVRDVHGGIDRIQEACKPFGDGMVHALVDQSFYHSTPIPQGLSLKETAVMQDVLEADVIIAAPVAKTHWAAGVTGSLKGMMGLIWDRMVMHRACDLEVAVVDLGTLLKPHLVVIDVTRLLSTNGPRGPGKVIKLDTVIASRDMVAADAKMVQIGEWFGRRFEPRQIRHIKLAHERGLGRMDVDNLATREVVVE